MKFVIVLSVLVAAALAGPAYNGNPREAVVLDQKLDNIGVDGYSYNYETSDGKSASEQAQVQNAGQENESLVVRGQYSYTGPDNVVYSVSYVADSEGFKPQGAHLPQPH